MTPIITNLLAIAAYLVQFVSTYLVPATVADLSILHVAVWTPVVLGLVGATGAMIHKMRPRQVHTFKAQTGRRRAAREVVVFLANNPGSLQRHVRQNTSLSVGDVEEAIKRLRKEGKLRRRWFSGSLELTAHGEEVAERATREVREEERAQKAAQKAAEQAQRAQERAQAQAEARAQKAAQKAAEQAQRAQERAQAQAEARAQKAAQKAAQPARGRRVASPEERAQKAAQKAAEQAQRAQERAAAREAREEERARRAAERVAAQRDPTTRAFGSDPSRIYEFRYRVVSLDSLITSNTDSGAVNPAYDPTLQPRQRQRAASQRQIEQAARNLVPEALLWDFRALDKGAPIVGGDLQVESGNGRALALRRARQAHPDQWANYQQALAGQLAAAGLAESDLAGVESPVLVRERVTEVADRAAFAREANAPPVLQMSTLETALVDSHRINGDLVGRLAVREGQSIDQALRTKANADFVRAFVGTMSENEAALLLRKDGTLAQAGIRRIKAALFVRTFEGEAGERLAETFLEALDSDIKNFETALSASLPVLARAEHRIASGERATDLSIADDASRALDMLSRLRESDTLTVEEYLGQSSMFERETTPFQDELLSYFDGIGRSPKKIREFFESYAAAVEDAPHPDQRDLFGDTVTVTKQELFERITKRNSAALAA